MKKCESIGCKNLVATKRSRFCYACIAKRKKETADKKAEMRRIQFTKRNRKTIYATAYAIPATLTGNKLIRAFNQVIEHKLGLQIGK